jgi:hypothetical protein
MSEDTAAFVATVRPVAVASGWKPYGVACEMALLFSCHKRRSLKAND